jgi:hypothetical protein
MFDEESEVIEDTTEETDESEDMTTAGDEA